MLATATRRRAPRPPSIQRATMPAPTGGLNTVDAGSAMPLSDCTQLYNLIPGEFGLRSRLGYREWLSGLGRSDNLHIRSLFYYHGSSKSGSADRLFAVTDSGIYDVTVSRKAWAANTSYNVGDIVINDDGKLYLCDTEGQSAASGGPTGTGSNIVDSDARWDYFGTLKKLAFASTLNNAGYGVFHAFTTTGGHFLAYADEENGYHLYTESTDSWTAQTLTGVTATNLAFVGSFKHRLFFAEKNTAKAWYLDLAAVTGAATVLNLEFAAKPMHGGDLVGVWNWTGDGGNGIDDRLVFVFRGGDIAVYEGTSPAAASTFALKGVWFAGAIPEGRHVVSDFGGDLLILTKNGLRPLSVLVNGGPEGSGQYLTKKISDLFNSIMLGRSTLPGWALHIHPEDNCLMVTHPTALLQNTEQLAMSLANGAWSRFDGLPIYSAAAGGGKLWFGSASGKIYINDGYMDAIALATPTTGTAIDWRVRTAYADFGRPTYKRVQSIRPLIQNGGSTTFTTAARYEYNASSLSSPDSDTVTSSEWGGGTWGTTTWGDDLTVNHTVRGATGVGVNVAIAIRGTANTRTVLTKIDVAYDEGGFL